MERFINANKEPQQLQLEAHLNEMVLFGNKLIIRKDWNIMYTYGVCRPLAPTKCNSLFLSLFIRFHTKTVIDVCLNETTHTKSLRSLLSSVCVCLFLTIFSAFFFVRMK